MKKFLHILLKILKWITIILLSIIVLFFIVRFIGRKLNNRTPDGGINEEMYVDINDSKQWVNIYGDDTDNPVMLYLHGGPGVSTSFGDWSILRKLAKDYTVINWDQRNCGKSWIKDPQDTPITPELMRSDLLEMVNYLLDYLGKEKLTILGCSWGTIYGADFAMNNPELVDCLIATSLVVDNVESDKALKEYLIELSADDPEYRELAEKFDPNNNYSAENNKIIYRLGEKYIPLESYFDGDVNVVSSVIFNPYYSILDLYKTIKFYDAENGRKIYDDFIFKYECYLDFSLKDKMEYEMPVYVLEGNADYQAVHTVAKEYFDKISAPDKEFRYIDGGHLAPMIQSEKLAEFVHEIAEKRNAGKK